MVVLIGFAVVGVLLGVGGLGGMLMYRYKMKQLQLEHQREETRQLSDVLKES